ARRSVVVSAILEQEIAELLELMEALADARPLPLRALSFVVIHAVEVRAPACARRRRHVLQRLEERVRNEELRAPALDRGVRGLRAADRRRGLADQAIAFVVPRPPAEKLTAEIRNDDRQLVIEG